MNNLIETSIKILDHGYRPNYITIFDEADVKTKRRRNYHNILSTSGKKVVILFSYKDDNGDVKDVATELEIPIMYSEVSVKDYIITELKNVLNNVN